MIRKGQVQGIEQGNSVSQVKFIESILALPPRETRIILIVCP